MSKNELFFQSSDKMTNIHMVTWEPDGEVVGIVQINHGVSEHIGRYEEFAKFLNSKGLVVVGIDLLGHGMSTNNGSKEMYFGKEGSFKYVVEDIHYALTQTKNNYPDVPYTMLGLSLGSFLTRSYMIDYPEGVDGAILIGTGYISKFKYKLARFVIDRETKKYGDDKATETIRDISFGTYNKKFKPNRTQQDWLCSNEEAIDEFLNDDLRGKHVTIGLFRELINSILYSCDITNINKMKKDRFIYMLSGGDDMVSAKGKDLAKMMCIYKDSGINDVEMKLYPGLRHDILHEVEKEQVFKDIYNWLISKNLAKEIIIESNNEDTSKKKEYDGLVDYDEYDIIWPDAMSEHDINGNK